MSKQHLKKWQNSNLQKHYDSLNKYCQYLSMNKWEKEDIIHDAFIKAIESYSDRDITPALLKKIVQNHWIDTLRKRKLEQNHAMKTEAVQNESAAEKMMLAEHVAEKLTNKQAAVFLLIEGFGYRIKEVAEVLQMTETAIKSILFRARNQMHKQHSGEGNDVKDASSLYYEALKQQNPDILIKEVLTAQKLHHTSSKRHNAGPILQMAA